jgi:hypothetical protein
VIKKILVFLMLCESVTGIMVFNGLTSNSRWHLHCVERGLARLDMHARAGR